MKRVKKTTNKFVRSGVLPRRGRARAAVRQVASARYRTPIYLARNSRRRLPNELIERIGSHMPMPSYNRFANAIGHRIYRGGHNARLGAAVRGVNMIRSRQRRNGQSGWNESMGRVNNVRGWINVRGRWYRGMN